MAPDIEVLQTHNDSFVHPSPKRRRLSTPSTRDPVVPRSDTVRGVNSRPTSHGGDGGVPPHPLRIRPLGNLYGSSTGNSKSRAGLFATFPDELVIQLLEYLGADDLERIGGSCKFLYAFSRAEELWKALFVASPRPGFQWQGTWRTTYLNRTSSSNIDCTGVFSDVLYRPFFCAHTSLNIFAANIPHRNQIARLEDLTVSDFTSSWYDKPFILTSPVRSWPVFQTWSTPSLLETYHDTLFRAEAVDWPLHVYASYMQNSSDESPLYLFDCRFAEKMNLKISDSPDPAAGYWPPACFGPDFFDVLDDQRPDRRWLIVGPARSGSTFHKDPNATSAWNAVIRGAKYWIMFPSSPTIPPPPGVYVSEDQSEVTSPLSIAEWLLGFHAEARATPGCKEGVCGEGEVLYVPSGWYHLVLNLEESVALTQNFIPRAHLAAALEFLRDKPDQVSGFKDGVVNPYELFVDRMKLKHPAVLEEGLRELEQWTKGKTSAWEALTKAEDKTDGFSFGFGADDDLYDDDDIP